MMKRFLLMLAVLAVVLAGIGFVKFQQIRAAIAMGKSFTPPPEAVTTVIVQSQDWQKALEATGTVVPVHGVTLSADQPGVVDRIAFESGTRVAAGQVLVELDTRQERAQLASAEAQRDLAKTRLERAKKLLDQQLLSQDEYDQTAAQAKQAEAAVHEVEATIGRKTIRAPFSGRAGIRLVNVGQYLRSGDPIVPLQQNNPIYVDFSVPQQRIQDLKLGESVEASSDSTGVGRGKITAINPVVDENTRNVQVQATFENSRELLRAGAYVTVRVVLGQGSPQLAVPVSAINYAPYGSSVFIVEKMKGPNGKEYLGVRQQFVQVGTSQGDQIAVTSGVRPGDQVVTSGVFKLRPNQAVMVDNRVQPSNSLAPRPANS